MMADDIASSLLDSSDNSSLLSSNSPNSSETTEQFLERISAMLSLAWEGTLGSESEKVMRMYMSSDFTNLAQSAHDSPFPFASSLEDHIKTLEALRNANPSWRTACFNFTASVHYDSGHAVVWFTSGASGDPGSTGDWSTNRESVSKIYWRLKENSNNEWECYSHECIRGPGDAS